MPKVRMPDGSLVEFGADALLNDDDTPLVLPPTGTRFFTEDDIARARQEEKDKLYGEINRNKEDLAELRNQVGTLTAAQQAEKDRLEAEAARLEAERRAAEEENLSAKDLVERRAQEWHDTLTQTTTSFEERLAEERAAREASEALLAREREFSGLKEYTQTQVAANQDNIAPQLLPYITGNSQEEIDASIARAISTTEQILADIQAVQPQVDQQQVVTPWNQQVAPPQQDPNAVLVPALPGTRATGGPANTDPSAQFQTLTAEQIKNMPMDQYAQLRGRLGVQQGNRSQGLYG